MPCCQALDRLGVGWWSVTVRRTGKAEAAYAAIGKPGRPFDYPEGGQAEVVETVLGMTNPRNRRSGARFVS